MTARQANEEKWAQLVARAWSDERLKQRILADPVSVLREHGIELPHGVEVRVVEPTPDRMYFLLPPKPANVAELTPDELTAVAGGADFTISKSIDTASSTLYSDSGSTTTTSSSGWSCAMF